MINKTNTNLIMKGAALKVEGASLQEGQTAPDFKLVANNLSDLQLSAFTGKLLVLSVVPSVDTPTCNLQTRRFNEEAKKLGDAVTFLTVSMDLPFAQKRWCEVAECGATLTASDHKYRTFGKAYGVYLPDTGLLARAVFVIDAKQKVSYIEYVQELSAEPDYDSALAVINKLIHS